MKAKDSLNNKASVLLKESFVTKDISSLFDKSIICGPNLWTYLTSQKADSIGGLDANFHIMLPDGSYKVIKGKIIQTAADANKLWQQLADNHTKIDIRKPKKEELSMYASLLAGTIEEPIFVVSINEKNYLINIDNRNLKFMFIEKLN